MHQQHVPTLASNLLRCEMCRGVHLPEGVLSNHAVCIPPGPSRFSAMQSSD